MYDLKYKDALHRADVRSFPRMWSRCGRTEINCCCLQAVNEVELIAIDERIQRKKKEWFPVVEAHKRQLSTARRKTKQTSLVHSCRGSGQWNSTAFLLPTYSRWLSFLQYLVLSQVAHKSCTGTSCELWSSADVQYSRHRRPAPTLAVFGKVELELIGRTTSSGANNTKKSSTSRAMLLYSGELEELPAF